MGHDTRGAGVACNSAVRLVPQSGRYLRESRRSGLSRGVGDTSLTVSTPTCQVLCHSVAMTPGGRGWPAHWSGFVSWRGRDTRGADVWDSRRSGLSRKAGDHSLTASGPTGWVSTPAGRSWCHSVAMTPGGLLGDSLCRGREVRPRAPCSISQIPSHTGSSSTAAQTPPATAHRPDVPS